MMTSSEGARRDRKGGHATPSARWGDPEVSPRAGQESGHMQKSRTPEKKSSHVRKQSPSTDAEMHKHAGKTKNHIESEKGSFNLNFKSRFGEF